MEADNDDALAALVVVAIVVTADGRRDDNDE